MQNEPRQLQHTALRNAFKFKEKAVKHHDLLKHITYRFKGDNLMRGCEAELKTCFLKFLFGIICINTDN